MTWLSPGFPVGAYSYSHGIENAVDAGLVHDRESLIDWIEAIVRFGAGGNDAVFLAATMNALANNDMAAVDRTAERAAAFRGTAELALESMAQGRAFLDAVRAGWPHPRLDTLTDRWADRDMGITYPVAVAVAAVVISTPPLLATAGYLQVLVANLVSAGVRLIPLGQTAGLLALADLEPVVRYVAQASLGRTIDDVGSVAAMVDWTSMAHERQYARLFRS